MVQPTHRLCGNPWSEEIYGGLGEHVTSLPIRNDRSRRTLVWVATGREQNAAMGCEERDGAVRSDSAIATGRFVAIRKRQVCYRYKTSERGL
ncbi:hypothetical protein Taro_021993 [Colocasia esculenta]|uniref:Uncharacterized protein n=1 Tax=Colocasia esculenta TaxID=4460 RepID=A0A843VD61_COLES|nr:hypothetical protein [Colocasia esculenta]